MPSKWLEKAASPKGANICGRMITSNAIHQKCASQKSVKNVRQKNSVKNMPAA